MLNKLKTNKIYFYLILSTISSDTLLKRNFITCKGTESRIYNSHTSLLNEDTSPSTTINSSLFVRSCLTSIVKVESFIL